LRALLERLRPPPFEKAVRSSADRATAGLLPGLERIDSNRRYADIDDVAACGTAHRADEDAHPPIGPTARIDGVVARVAFEAVDPAQLRLPVVTAPPGLFIHQDRAQRSGQTDGSDDEPGAILYSFDPVATADETQSSELLGVWSVSAADHAAAA
jgi:hypothetical protein